MYAPFSEEVCAMAPCCGPKNKIADSHSTHTYTRLAMYAPFSEEVCAMAPCCGPTNKVADSHSTHTYARLAMYFSFSEEVCAMAGLQHLPHPFVANS